MENTELQLIQIGNSKGIRIPAEIIKKYKMGKSLILESCADYLIIHPKKNKKMTWKQTFESMAKAKTKEDWTVLDHMADEGLDED